MKKIYTEEQKCTILQRNWSGESVASISADTGVAKQPASQTKGALHFPGGASNPRKKHPYWGARGLRRVDKKDAIFFSSPSELWLRFR